MDNRPAYHGRTHLPGGTDPIAGTEQAIITVTTAQSIAAPGLNTPITWSTTSGNVLVNAAGDAIYSLADTNTAIQTSEQGFYRLDGVIALANAGVADDFEREPMLYVNEDGTGAQEFWGGLFPDNIYTMAHYIPGSTFEPDVEWHEWDRCYITNFYNWTTGVTTVKFTMRELDVPGTENIFAYLMVTRLCDALTAIT